MNKKVVPFADIAFSNMGNQIKLEDGFSEIIHNSYDAKAKNIKIYSNNNNNSLIIVDDGEGMTFEQMENHNLGGSDKKDKIGEFGYGQALYCKKYCNNVEIVSIYNGKDKNNEVIKKLINFTLQYDDKKLYIDKITRKGVIFRENTYETLNDNSRSDDYDDISEKLKIKQNGYAIELKYNEENDYKKMIEYLKSYSFNIRIPENINIYLNEEKIIYKDYLNGQRIEEKNEEYILELSNENENNDYNKKIQIKKNGIVIGYINSHDGVKKKNGLQNKLNNGYPNLRISIDIKKNFNEYFITDQDKAKITPLDKVLDLITTFLKKNLKSEHKKEKKKNEYKISETDKKIFNECKTLEDKKKCVENHKLHSTFVKLLFKEKYPDTKKPNVEAMFIKILELEEENKNLKKKKEDFFKEFKVEDI